MEQQVTVIAVEGDEAIVHGRRASACGDCAGKASCSTMGSWVERMIELRLKNPMGAKPGDEVLLDVPDNAVLKIAFRLYALPMLAFILVGLMVRSLALFMGWPEAEAIAAVAGFMAVLGCYACYKVFFAASKLDVKMIRILPKSCEQHSHQLLSSPD
ncbi:MAG: SoxR reducing system RseC family protein [Mariprofundus sp.]